MTGPYAGGIIDTIDARIQTQTSVDRRTGTVVTRDATGLYAQVTIDPGGTAVPVKVLRHVDVYADDRVVLEKFGGDWVVVGTWTERPTGRNIIGGKWYTTAGALVLAVAGTEALCNIDTGSLTLPANKLIAVHAQPVISTSATGTTYLFRIRDTGLSGTQRHEQLYVPASASQGYEVPIEMLYQTSTVPEVKTFALTLIRLGGAGTADISAGGATISVFMYAEVKGPAGILTFV
jgi:hypothetical protein